MKQTQKALRHEAAEAFMESLEQLEYRLSPTPNLAPAGRAMGHASSPSLQQPTGLDRLIQEFEDAVADIEQHIPD